MLIAIPVWQGRVSPVFDVAGQMLVVERYGDGEVARREVALPDAEPDKRARALADLGVTTLICGAISRPLESLLAASRIRVISGVCGDIEDVLEAVLSGNVNDGRFAMPGCSGRRRRRHRGRCRGGESR